MQIFIHHWRELLVTFSIIIGLLSYIAYFKSIFNGKTKPHIFSWGIWSIVGMVAFAAQLAGWWGWGSMMLWFTACVCVAITFLSLKYGDTQIDTLDIISLICALMAIVLWKITTNPFYASLFAMFADAIWYIPTVRKTWKNPETEPASYYWLSNLKHGLALFSLREYNPTTIMFSSSVIFINCCILGIQFLRKK
jgi:hypothetical protein